MFSSAPSLAKLIKIVGRTEFSSLAKFINLKIVGRIEFSDPFPKIIIRHKRIGFDLNARRQSACLVIYPITVDNFAALFICMPLDRASDYMMAQT